MYFQRDYILRMIEMMGDLMRRIAELMDDLSRMKLLDDACLHHTGLTLETVEALTTESLMEMLQPMPRLMVSELIYAHVTSFSLQEEETEALLHKSLRMLASLWNEGPLCEARAERLLEMKERIRPRLAGNELMDCARFFSQAERYSEMEDALFQAVELAQDAQERASFIREGTQMLETAALAAPEALILARQSKEELQQAVRELPLWRS